MKAIRRNLRISPKKVNLVAGLVRGKPVEEAINFLRFAPKRSAGPLMELVKSAVSNAEHNYKQNRKDLFISSLVVCEGPTLKRSRPVSRGRTHPILKRTTHITLEVAVRIAPTVIEKKPAKASKKISSTEPKSETSVAPKKTPRAAKPKAEAEPTT